MLIDMEDSPRKKKRLLDDFKQYLSSARPTIEQVDTSEDESPVAPIKNKNEKKDNNEGKVENTVVDESFNSAIPKVQENWFSDVDSEVDEKNSDNENNKNEINNKDNDAIDSDSGTDSDHVINNDNFLWQYDEVDVPHEISYTMHEINNTNSSRQPIPPEPTVYPDSHTVTQQPPTVPPNPLIVLENQRTTRTDVMKLPTSTNAPKKYATLNPPREMSLKRKRQLMYIEMQKQQKSPQDKGNEASSNTPTHPPDDTVGGRVTRASSSKKQVDKEDLSGSFSPLAVSQPNKIRTQVAGLLRKKMPAIDEDSEDDGADLYALSKKSKKANSKKSKK
jgi:hypothetical protein